MDEIIALIDQYLADGFETIGPPPPEGRLFLKVTLDVLLSPDNCLHHAVSKLGLDETIRLLVQKRGSPAVRAALGKIGGRPKVSAIIYTYRHALNLFCQGHGLRNDWAVARALVPIFALDSGERRSLDAMYRLVQRARRVVEDDEVELSFAQKLANSWLHDYRGKDLSSGLRQIAKHLTSTPPF